MAVPSLPPVPPAVQQPASQLDLDSAVVPDVIRALCQATGHDRFVMSPDVVGSGKRLTFAVAGSTADVWRDGLAVLGLAGISGSCAKNGLCSFVVREDAKAVDPAPVVLTYRPRFRDVAFLAQSVASAFQGWHFAGMAAGPAAGGASAVSAVSAASGSGSGGPSAGRAEPVQSVPVQLVGVGPGAERSRVLAVLAELDKPVESLLVRVAVYEVDTSSSNSSAIDVVFKALGSAVQVGGGVATSLATANPFGLTLKVGDFQAVLAALNTSSLAHLVTSPVLRTSSGVLASFAVGDSVPTLGSVSYAGNNGTAVQSIQYQQSGVVFSVVPELVGGQVDVALYQSVSSFTPTTVGVTSSPTLQNRVLSSDLVVRPGEAVVLGGLMQTSDTKGKTGWWFVPDISHQRTQSKTELVLVLSVDVDRRP